MDQVYGAQWWVICIWCLQKTMCEHEERPEEEETFFTFFLELQWNNSPHVSAPCCPHATSTWPRRPGGEFVFSCTTCHECSSSTRSRRQNSALYRGDGSWETVYIWKDAPRAVLLSDNRRRTSAQRPWSHQVLIRGDDAASFPGSVYSKSRTINTDFTAPTGWESPQHAVSVRGW